MRLKMIIVMLSSLRSNRFRTISIFSLPGVNEYENLNEKDISILNYYFLLLIINTETWLKIIPHVLLFIYTLRGCFVFQVFSFISQTDCMLTYAFYFLQATSSAALLLITRTQSLS